MNIFFLNKDLKNKIKIINKNEFSEDLDILLLIK